MSDSYIYTSIFLMALTTYLIRVIPLLVLRKPVKNKFFRSFLYYAPYVTLSVMTFPSILYSTGSFTSALIGSIAAFLSAFFGLGLPVTAAVSCAITLVLQLVL